MSPQQKVLQTLNRFTFGPRPGDVARVDRVGLNAWFEQQLHPERIDDARLTMRLAEFPAMQLSQSELFERFPSPQMLRQYSRGAIPPPNDPVERAVFADASLSYKDKVLAKASLQSTAASAATPSLVQPLPATTAIFGLKAAGTTPDSVAETKQRLQSSPMDQAGVQAILALSPADRMRRLIALSPEEMQGFRAALKGGQQQQLTAGLSPVEAEQVAAMQAPARVVGAEVESTRLLRDVYSDRQLQAVMTDFWLNHFNVYARKNQNEPYLLPAYEREAILPHALGRFEELLIATAQSPAMLVYLDNWTSIGPDSRAGQRNDHGPATGPTVLRPKVAGKAPRGINENYARELMELHTLGVNGGYTQGDVIEVAKCFTGWTIDRPDEGSEFVFNANRHEPGPKTVLGHAIPEGGEDEGLAVLHLLATSPATARFLSLQLAERFVSDSPPPALVDRMAAAYLRSDGDIATVLRTMFHAPQFWSSAAYRAKVKTPLEFVASALRAGDAEVTNAVPLVGALNKLGMPLYGMQTPNGYGQQASDWVSSTALLTRMNFALVLAANHLPGTHLAWAGVVQGQSATPVDSLAEQRLENDLLDEPAAPRTRAAVLEQAADPTVQRVAEQDFAAARPALSGVDNRAMAGSPMLRVGTLSARGQESSGSPLDTMAGLLLGSPDFQRR